MLYVVKLDGVALTDGPWHGDSPDDVCAWVAWWYRLPRARLTAELAGK